MYSLPLMTITSIILFVFQALCLVQSATIPSISTNREILPQFNATSLELKNTDLEAQGLIRKVKSKMGLWYPYDDDDDDEPHRIEYHEHPKHEIYVDYKDEHFIRSFPHNTAPIDDCQAAIAAIPDHQVFGEGAVIQYENCCIFLAPQGPDMPGFLVKERSSLILEQCPMSPGGPVSGAYDVEGTRTVCIGRNPIECLSPSHD